MILGGSSDPRTFVLPKDVRAFPRGRSINSSSIISCTLSDGKRNNNNCVPGENKEVYDKSLKKTTHSPGITQRFDPFFWHFGGGVGESNTRTGGGVDRGYSGIASRTVGSAVLPALSSRSVTASNLGSKTRYRRPIIHARRR